MASVYRFKHRSPVSDTEDLRATTLKDEHRSKREFEKGVLPVPWNWTRVCFWQFTPAWHAVAVKTDSSFGMSLKFISASQGRVIVTSSTAPLTNLASVCPLAHLGSPNTRSMLSSMIFVFGGRTSGCPGPSHKCQYTGTRSCLGESIWTNRRSLPDSTSAPSKGSSQCSAGPHEPE